MNLLSEKEWKSFKRCKTVCIILLCFAFTTAAQNRSGRQERGGFSLAGRNAAQQADSLSYETDADTTSTSRINAFRLTDLGDRYMVPMDTNRLNTANSMLVEGQGIAVAHTGNIGSPSQSRIFSERKEERDFIFADTYDHYIITPQNGYFYDTKLPYSNVTYNRAGGAPKREEQLEILLTGNYGKQINVGWDFDYIYSRGFYNSNGNKIINYRFFGNYLSDRYEAHAHLRNANIVNGENGGILNDRNVTHPEDFGTGRPMDSKEFQTRMSDTWNRVRGKNIFLTHRYNLGFYRDLTDRERAVKRENEIRREEEQARILEDDPEQQQTPNENKREDPHADEVFVPVSSIIHTFEFEDYSRRFITNNRSLDGAYPEMYGSPDSVANDYTSAWRMRNTLALSLREGFQDWVKTGLTAFVYFEKRQFSLSGYRLSANLPDISITNPNFSPYLPLGNPSFSWIFSPNAAKYDEFSTFIGAELSKKRGSLFTYNARGEFCVVGSNLGEFRLTGNAHSTFSLFGKTTSLQADGYIKNTVPAFLHRHYHSRYFWWDRNLKNVQQVYVGGTVAIDQTKTRLSAGIESIQHFVYFDTLGMPSQFDSNIQVITGRFKQDFRYKAFGWENELVYQLSSNRHILPLPDLSLYSNMYVAFTLVKVLSVQIGADIHYHTSYYAPYYEPATQQFQNQDQIKIGNYPLINAYLNFHLKQARFFITSYNLGSILINNPAYFSMPHYPLNPMVIKMGVSVMFNN